MTKLLAVLLLAASALCGQDSFLRDWLDRSDQAKADQPFWMTPVATVTPRLEQRYNHAVIFTIRFPF